MDEKDLLGLYEKFAAPYSYMDYPRVASRVENQEGDLIATQRVTEMPETFWDQSGLDMEEMENKLMNDIADARQQRPLTDVEAYKKPFFKPEQSALEKLLAKKELSVAETLDLYKRGLKPYFYSYRPNTLVELTVENENELKDKISITNTKWLHPKIAEKIQARYQEMNDLVQKKGAAIREIDSQIEDLKLRISMIEETGTDLII
jgi:hypothetical protein